MNILVVGGAGYIGSNMTKLLAKTNHQVVIVDDLSTGFEIATKYGKFYNTSIANKDKLKEILLNHKIECVMHFAAKCYVGESCENPLIYYKNNVTNTISLLEAMLECNVKKFIFSSTCATFGVPSENDSKAIHEKLPQNPINPYGRTKLIIENILTDFDKAYGLKSIILRYFNAAGADIDGEMGEAHNPETHLIPLVFDSISGKDFVLTVNGDDYETPDGTCVRDYVHITDIANAHLLALNYLNINNISNNFNLGSEKGFSVLEIIKAVEKVTGKKVEYKVGPRRAGDPPILIGKSDKAKEVLKWEAKYSLEEIIQTAWKFYTERKNLYGKK